MENPFIVEKEQKKDMKTVADYNKKRELKIFRGQCFNNACVLMASVLPEGKFLLDDVVFTTIFKAAEQLYDEGLKRNYLMFEEDNRHINKETGKLEAE